MKWLDRIEKFRKEKGLTQEEIAKMLGISRITYIRAVKKNDDVRVSLEKTCSLIEANIDYFFSKTPQQIVFTDSIAEKIFLLAKKAEKREIDVQLASKIVSLFEIIIKKRENQVAQLQLLEQILEQN